MHVRQELEQAKDFKLMFNVQILPTHTVTPLSKNPVLHEHCEETGVDILFELNGHVRQVEAKV